MVKHAAGAFLFVGPRSQSARFDQVRREIQVRQTPSCFGKVPAMFVLTSTALR